MRKQRANAVRPVLSDIGLIVENEIDVLSNTYSGIFVNKHVIIPNHIHLILFLSHNVRTQFAPTISRVIKQFKGAVTKQVGYSIWQKSFHDHIIRDEVDYQYHWQYIDDNPLKWTEDEYYNL